MTEITPAFVDPFRNAAEEADGNMHVFRRGLAIRAARRVAAGRKDAETTVEAETPWARVSASAAAGLCMCHMCSRERGELPMILVVCPECGNKRCPKASDHRLACTGSNAVGQPGSVF